MSSLNRGFLTVEPDLGSDLMYSPVDSFFKRHFRFVMIDNGIPRLVQSMNEQIYERTFVVNMRVFCAILSSASRCSPAILLEGWIFMHSIQEIVDLWKCGVSYCMLFPISGQELVRGTNCTPHGI